MTLKEIQEGITIDPTKIEKIKKLDSIVFDCDGVLIDVSNSYDLTIKKTVDFILKEMTQVKESGLVTTKMIEGFKASGGFNDEIDVTYALILAIVSAKKRNEPFSDFIDSHVGLLSCGSALSRKKDGAPCCSSTGAATTEMQAPPFAAARD